MLPFIVRRGMAFLIIFISLLLGANACASFPKHTHDPLGLRTNLARQFGPVSSSVGPSYDNIGQLTSWSGKEAGGALRWNEQRGWNYDAAGNLHFRTNSALLQTFTVNDANELTGISRNNNFTVTGNTASTATNVTVNGATADRYADFTFARTNQTLVNGNNNFTVVAQNPYGLSVTNTWTQNLPQNVTLQSDLNGNLTNDGLKSFFYDAENQLTNITVANQWKTEFVYDGFGRRRMAKDYGWQGGAWVKTNETRYVYDGLLAIQERDANNATLVTYTRGLDLSGTRQGAGGIGGLLARTDGNGSAFYHADGSGNVTALMNSTGELVARYLYDPFGNLVGKWGPLADANRYRFSSKEVHPQSGLYYYGFRFYEPNLQRWLNQDPLGEGGGINLYGFVGNNPLNFVDPYGLAKGPVPGPLGDFAEKGGQAIWEFLNQAGKAIDWAFDETIGRAADWLDQKWRDSGLPVPPEMSPEEQARFDQMLQMAGMVGPLKCKVKVRGSYTHTFESNIQYIGKGTKDRPSVSGKQIENKTGDKLIKTEFEPSKPNTDVQAFKDEAQKIRNTGGIPNDNLYNKINSPGEKMLPPSED